MPKNLILIHLESISNTILWQYRVELGTVWRLMQQSFVYNRYYASSTSTDTVVVELLNGCSDVFDGISLFKERNDPGHPWNRNNPRLAPMPTCASFAGYDTFFPIEYYLGHPRRERDLILDYNMEHIFAATRERLEKSKTTGKPLYMLFRPAISHMAFDDAVKLQAKTFSERFRLGYLQLDRSVNRLLSMLIELGLWDNSVIVCYGDHGDELWSHGLNKGYCHAIPPYASLTWTPLFIHDSGREPGSSNRLVSAIDLRESLLKLLLPGFDPTHYEESWGARRRLPPFRQSPYDGIDAFNEERELAFAQNLFALQVEYSDPEQGLTKGYSVTDGTYRVVVSSGGKTPRNGGLEFFCDQVDPANTRNLLDFFTLDLQGDIKKFSPPAEAVDGGFALTFNEDAVAHLIVVYHKLKKALYELVRDKERRSLPFSSGPTHVMPDSAFKRARQRLFKD